MSVLICKPSDLFRLSLLYYTLMSPEYRKYPETILNTFILDYELCLQLPWEPWGCHACEESDSWEWRVVGPSGQLNRGGGVRLTGHKKPATLLWGFRSRTTPWERRRATNLRAPLLLGQQNKTAGVITNSLLTGSIIYEPREEVLQARGFFGIPSRPELGWCGEDSAWGAPTASLTRAWCTVPWVQRGKGLRGRCRELKRAVYLSSVPSMYTRAIVRELQVHTDGILYVFAHPCVCAGTWSCMNSDMHWLYQHQERQIRDTHIYSLDLLLSSKAVTATNQARNSAYIKKRYLACINSHWIAIFSPTMAHFKWAWCQSENQS